MGQCHECSAWGTITEEIIVKDKSAPQAQGKLLSLSSLDRNYTTQPRTSIPIGELNRVFGGGLVDSSAILIGGEPGIGKSTLLLQLVISLADKGFDSVYITAEESVEQVKARAMRLELTAPNVHISSGSNIEDILATIAHKKPRLLIVDSIQTVYTKEVGAAAGTVSQIKAATHILISYIKQHGISLILVGHITKDGQLAGPKLLEHMVDTVLYFESDPHYYFRILRTIKNRFGEVNEIGVFEMTAKGLIEVTNPSSLFLSNRNTNISGTSVFAGVEGARALLMEIQALLAHSSMATPRRSVVGWDTTRLSMIVAVLAVRYGLNLASHEIYLSVAGGLKIAEPAADLAVAAALISAANNKPLRSDIAFFGEVSLSGEIRKVSHLDTRLKEARKLGFTQIVCRSAAQTNESDIVNISHITELKNIIK